MRILLTEDAIKNDIATFYKNVGVEIGYVETGNTQYDCTKINVSEHIQELFFEYYKKQYNAAIWEIAMLLGMSGPKVNKDLKDNEIEILDGFITEVIK